MAGASGSRGMTVRMALALVAAGLTPLLTSTVMTVLLSLRYTVGAVT